MNITINHLYEQFYELYMGEITDLVYNTFVKNGQQIHQVSPRRLVTEAILIKIRKKANQGISKKDIQKFEQKNGKIKDGSTVVFNTGWQVNLQKEFYFTKNPGLTVSAAKYLASKKLNLIGIRIDKASVLRDKTLGESTYLNPDTNYTPIAIVRDIEDEIHNETIIPRSHNILKEGDLQTMLKMKNQTKYLVL